MDIEPPSIPPGVNRMPEGRTYRAAPNCDDCEGDDCEQCCDGDCHNCPVSNCEARGDDQY